MEGEGTGAYPRHVFPSPSFAASRTVLVCTTIDATIPSPSTRFGTPTKLTLSGGAHGIWIFQIAKTLKVGSGTIVALKGGAQARHIFWQVAGKVTLDSTSAFKGTILSKTAIVMKSGATLKGRALAQTAVTLIADSVTRSF